MKMIGATTSYVAILIQFDKIHEMQSRHPILGIVIVPLDKPPVNQG